MVRIFYSLLVLSLLTSCVNTYNITGTSSIPHLDGRMLYLKSYKNEQLKTVDSCEIIHGEFMLTGTIDSTKFVSLFMDEDNIMPVVLEDGDILIRIDNANIKATGTPLNNRLTEFIEEQVSIQNDIMELSHKHSQAIMEGMNMEHVNIQLMREHESLTKKEDKLITSFITENFDNVLGPGVFLMMTAGHEFPELSPWIEDIMSKATDKFKNDPYVKDYYEKACRNQDIMNGMAIPDAPAMPQQSQMSPALTPAQLAQPAN